MMSMRTNSTRAPVPKSAGRRRNIRAPRAPAALGSDKRRLLARLEHAESRAWPTDQTIGVLFSRRDITVLRSILESSGHLTGCACIECRNKVM